MFCFPTSRSHFHQRHRAASLERDGAADSLEEGSLQWPAVACSRLQHPWLEGLQGLQRIKYPYPIQFVPERLRSVLSPRADRWDPRTLELFPCFQSPNIG